ncbi:MAG: PhoH family protein, partial [Clostridia bacterium]|nr:PhoH family protein [Clostridia bacterium]
MRTTVEKQFESYETLMGVFGELDTNVDRIKAEFSVEIFASGNSVKIVGEEQNVQGALRALNALEVLAKKDTIKPQQLSSVIDCAKSGEDFDVKDLLSQVAVTARGKIIRAKTFGQKAYVDAIKKNSIVFGVGPAGTGKT